MYNVFEEAFRAYVKTDRLKPLVSNTIVVSSPPEDHLGLTFK